MALLVAVCVVNTRGRCIQIVIDLQESNSRRKKLLALRGPEKFFPQRLTRSEARLARGVAGGGGGERGAERGGGVRSHRHNKRREMIIGRLSNV
ncbi:hypothetical protein RR46_00861 [Papilio xuthus]|uniref:Uncharacterized protein n=1 Tax=Papilio xuthus TaxID=66420 RepID=A0A0N1I9P2_PAPXU|nr:hypothetical protein RR46_00861 [Papilio xuthus]